MSKPVIKVLVTGAAGQIAYSLLPLVASGAMLGKDQPVVLHLLDIPPALDALNGVVLELQDGAYPLLAGSTSAATPLGRTSAGYGPGAARVRRAPPIARPFSITFFS